MALMLLASFLFGVEFAIIRHSTATVHPFEVTFFRNLFGLLVLMPWLFPHFPDDLMPWLFPHFPDDLVIWRPSARILV